MIKICKWWYERNKWVFLGCTVNFYFCSVVWCRLIDSVSPYPIADVEVNGASHKYRLVGPWISAIFLAKQYILNPWPWDKTPLSHEVVLALEFQEAGSLHQNYQVSYWGFIALPWVHFIYHKCDFWRGVVAVTNVITSSNYSFVSKNACFHAGINMEIPTPAWVVSVVVLGSWITPSCTFNNCWYQ